MTLFIVLNSSTSHRLNWSDCGGNNDGTGVYLFLMPPKEHTAVKRTFSGTSSI